MTTGARSVVVFLTIATTSMVSMVTIVSAADRPANQGKPKVDAKAVYEAHCQVCHGPDGKAPTPEMSFVGRTWKNGTRTADMIKVINEGVAGTAMLPFTGKLTPAEVNAVAALVRSYDKRLKPEK